MPKPKEPWEYRILGSDRYNRNIPQNPLTGKVHREVTGNGQQQDRIKTKEAKSDHHLLKAVENGELERIFGGRQDNVADSNRK